MSTMSVIRIPMDILQEVFGQCSSSPLRVYEARKFPWYLGQVCSHWRALFFSMRSTFWNKIVIQENYRALWAIGLHLKAQEIVAFFIDRAHGQPFSFVFFMKTYAADLLHPVLADLCAHSEQWEEASIQLPSVELEHLCSVKGRLPLLKKLEISVVSHLCTRGTIAAPGMVTNVFEDAPLLTHVGLQEDLRWQFNFNRSSLTIVNIKYPEPWESVLAILRETTNLVELTLRFSYTSLQHIEGGGLIHLPQLERLSVDWTPFLTVLETPFLQQLKIVLGFHYNLNLNNARTTLSFLRRLGIKLNTFLIQSGVDGDDVKEILRCMPEVDRLALLSVPDTVFKWLAETGTQELRFSNLIVSGYRGAGVLEALHDVIACRNSPGDVENPNPKEVTIRTPGGQEGATNLQSLCGDRGIRFGFIHEMSISPWGLDPNRPWWEYEGLDT